MYITQIGGKDPSEHGENVFARTKMSRGSSGLRGYEADPGRGRLVGLA